MHISLFMKFIINIRPASVKFYEGVIKYRYALQRHLSSESHFFRAEAIICGFRSEALPIIFSFCEPADAFGSGIAGSVFFDLFCLSSVIILKALYRSQIVV